RQLLAAVHGEANEQAIRSIEFAAYFGLTVAPLRDRARVARRSCTENHRRANRDLRGVEPGNGEPSVAVVDFFPPRIEHLDLQNQISSRRVERQLPCRCAAGGEIALAFRRRRLDRE